MAFRKAKKPRSSIRTAYIRTDPSGETTASVEWSDGAWTSGDPRSVHMKALLDRTEREGIRVLRYGHFDPRRTTR